MDHKSCKVDKVHNHSAGVVEIIAAEEYMASKLLHLTAQLLKIKVTSIGGCKAKA